MEECEVIEPGRDLFIEMVASMGKKSLLFSFMSGTQPFLMSSGCISASVSFASILLRSRILSVCLCQQKMLYSISSELIP